MRKAFRTLLAALALVASQSFARAAEDADGRAIKSQLQRYETALNSSDIETVMMLYSADPVFMPQNRVPAAGRAAVRKAYEDVFGAIKLNIRFDVDEVTRISSVWAYARTRSTGTVTALGFEEAPAPEANQELFLLKKEKDGQWRFARYIFSTTRPAVARQR